MINRYKDNETELLADVIADQIRRKIESREYKAGDRLTVRRLCEAFSTSETPVKQALNQLMATGLVVSTPGCGMRVRSFDARDMQNILEARLMIELYCARDAVARVRQEPHFADEIRELLARSNEDYARCAESYTRESFNAAHERDARLHLSIVESCRNPEILSMYSNLNTHAGMFTGFERHSPESVLNVIREHTAIADALCDCDTDRLRDALRAHIRTTIEIYRS